MALVAIKNTHSKVATATHNMFAARILVDGRMLDYADDDGEYGGWGSKDPEGHEGPGRAQPCCRGDALGQRDTARQRQVAYHF